MALTEQTVVTSINILEDGQIGIRRTRRVFDDADVIGERHAREVLEPGQDVTAYPQKIRSICAVVWTPAVIAAYAAAKAARQASQPQG